MDVTCSRGRQGRKGIALHVGEIHSEDRATRDGVPVTSVPRTLFDLAEVIDEQRLERASEEADRLNLLQMRALERVCERSHGRHALRPIRRLIAAAHAPITTCSPLEERFIPFCRDHDLPPPTTNVFVKGREVDALWPGERLIVELDGFTYHGHRAAFERDRARDATLQAAGYRVIRITHRRLNEDSHAVVKQLRRLLGLDRNT